MREAGPRRAFGAIERDAPPDLTCVEALPVRTWIRALTPAAEVASVVSERGGVTRLLEQTKADVESECIVAAADFSLLLDPAPNFVRLRNALVEGADQALGLNGLERHLVGFDLAIASWWRLCRDGPIYPAL